ncbi:hypothetical protein [Tritonibacter mobilis]|uniref:hypothetical protein n=1 Tax=Tritonibacter mobilis TaxID=379347 RepID=UPI001CD9C049|nr:hypothetical protein [Tritonibacter mobilis]MCA2009136.1 hypothetical protein [Tritonibacter mobilis]
MTITATSAAYGATDHLIALTDHLFNTAEAAGLAPTAVDSLSALKDALEQLGVATEGVSLGQSLSAPDVAFRVSCAVSKIREAHELAGVPPYRVKEAVERLHAAAGQ